MTVKAGDRSAADAALRYVDSPIAELRGLVRLDWDAMDGWFEEDGFRVVLVPEPWAEVTPARGA